MVQCPRLSRRPAVNIYEALHRYPGLRHSDVYNLKRSDVKGEYIEITTKKTADSLTIELNDVVLPFFKENMK